MGFSFECQANCSHTKARAGIFHTPHGIVETPRFMPVGTLATVKGVIPQQLEAANSQMILANTYHLHIQPGEDIVREAGGLHSFMAWDKPILTDSGGFQVFSLSEMRKLTEEGVVFKSPRDGSTINMTPERSIQIQNALGADVIMAFDECPPADATREEVQAATDRSYRWLKRCIAEHQDTDKQALFGIIQGGIHLDLRQKAVEELAELDLPGYAIGGVSVGEDPKLINATVRHTAPLLPANKPRYLMGVGTYREMAQAIASGIDLFDCVIPTRLGRHGAALIRGIRTNIKNAPYKRDYRPLDETCSCYACQNFSRAYLNHMLRSHEMVGQIMISLHNITELIRFTQEIREAIFQGTFANDFAHWLEDEPE